jgi:dephospho-CoA kinase
MLKIGLTGGIGCGKSTVADMFAAKGIPVLDADRIARDLVEPGQPALQAIAQRFGPGLLKAGRLDRERLKHIVFADPEERRWLEGLLHPLVYDEMRRRIATLSAPYCLLMVPLLLESGRRDFVDRVLVVDCPAEVQRQRIRCRDGSSDAEIERVLSAQLSREARLAAADDIIENAGLEADLPERVEALHRFYLSLGKG